MSIENFFTTQSVSLPGQSQAAGKAQGLPGANAQGVSFLDFILGQLDQANGNAQDAVQKDKGTPLQSDNALLKKKAGLDLAALLATNPDIEEEINGLAESTGLPPGDVLTQVLALNQQAFDETLKPLTDGIITSAEIVKGSPRVFQALLIEDPKNETQFQFNINSLKEKIQSMLEKGDTDLSALNLTPEQIDIIQNLQDGAELPDDLQGNPFLTIIKLVAPTNRPETEDLKAGGIPGLQDFVISPFALNPQQQKQSALDPARSGQTSQGPHGPIQLLTSRLNALNTGGEGDPLFTIEEYKGQIQAAQDGTGKTKSAGNQGLDALMDAGSKGKAPPAASMDLSVLQNWPFPAGSALFSTGEYGSGFTDRYGLNTASSAPSTLGTLTSLVTQAANAQAAHPATQLVAATLQKAAGAGENKTLTLQLDPPELGRVQVKMTFGADKKIKAVLLSEKPETHMMLQRDAQTLERALQSVNLDSDGGLSFELAQQGLDFDQGNRRGGGHDAGGTGGAAREEIETIESTMTWQIDPQTGHTRYDIVA